MKSELQKAQAAGEGLPDIPGLSDLVNSDADVRELIALGESANSQSLPAPQREDEGSDQQGNQSQLERPGFVDDGAGSITSPLMRSSTDSVPCYQAEEPISNPLGLVADASGEARAQDKRDVAAPVFDAPGPSITSPLSETGPQNLARKLLRRRGYISLGLKLNKESLETGLDALFAYPGLKGRYSDYFKPSDSTEAPDTGPDLDPVDLGLITMEEAHYLFPM